MTKLIRGNRKLEEKGATMVLFMFLIILVIIPIVGLAIDGSIVMWEKARLSSSVDAAAYAAGRSLSIGSDTTTAKTAAAATARTYFNANFQPGSMGTSVSQFAPGSSSDVPDPVSGLWTISVSSTVNVPLYFLRLIGFNSTTLTANAQVSRKNINIIIVLDRSASLSLYDNNASCNAMKASAQNFVNMFAPSQDDLGLITFQTTANLDFKPGTDFKTRSVYGVNGMSQLISKIQCVGYTNTVSALNLAYYEIANDIHQPGALNVIVFFSDGKPDAITADFLAKDADTRNAVADPFTYGSSLASTCTTGPTPMRGVLVALDENPDSTASTLGILPAPPLPSVCTNCGSPIDQTLPSDTQYPWGSPWGLLPYPISSSNSPGCNFSSSSNQSFSVGYSNSHGLYWCSGASCNVRNDIQTVPDQDVFGNLTNTGYRSLTSPAYGLFSSGPYATKIRPDTAQGVVNASMNAAFEQVKQIRADNTYKPIIYTIGLGQYIDDNFMRDVANDKSAPNYDATRPVGQYVKAPTASQLSSAFQQIASQVLRISQ